MQETLIIDPMPFRSLIKAMLSHQEDQATTGRRPDALFRLSCRCRLACLVPRGQLRNYPCCTSNFHQGYPKFAANLFFESPETKETCRLISGGVGSGQKESMALIEAPILEQMFLLGMGLFVAGYQEFEARRRWCPFASWKSC